MKQEIIYSLRVMLELVKKGHNPVSSFPNPKNPKYLCWTFKWDETFQKDLEVVLRGVSDNG